MVKNNNAKHRLSRCADCRLNKQLWFANWTNTRHCWQGHTEVSGLLVHNPTRTFHPGFAERQVISSAHADFEMKTRSSVHVVCQRRLSSGGRREMSGAASFPPTSERTRSMLITANYAKFWLIIGELGDGSRELNRGAWKPPVCWRRCCGRFSRTWADCHYCSFTAEQTQI